MQIIFIRTLILYLAITISLRLLGKRQIGELEPSELVVTLLLSELAAVPMQNPGIPLLHGFIPICVIVGLEILLTFGTMKSLRFRRLLNGGPSILISNGVIDEKQMQKNRITTDELLEELRIQRITDLSKIKYAILETGGQLSTLLKASENPATAKQVNVDSTETGLPIVLISDGRLLKNNMEFRGVTSGYIEQTLKEKGISSYRDVFLMTLDEAGGAFILKKAKKREDAAG